MKIKQYLLVLALSGASTLGLFATNNELDTAKIDQLKGKLNQEEHVYKVSLPRNDVKVAVDGWMMPAFMGLGTWAAFQGQTRKRW